MLFRHMRLYGAIVQPVTFMIFLWVIVLAPGTGVARFFPNWTPKFMVPDLHIGE